MKETELKYGCNPNQKPARIFMADGSDLPIRVLNGRPGYINFLDAFNSWQLVRELEAVLHLPAAASFKHVSPSGAAVGLPLSPAQQKACRAEDVPGLNDSPLACAYVRARGTDRMSSFGDWVALSRPCDKTTAAFLKHEVSDGIIAPGYDPEALEILMTKRRGTYNIVEIDSSYVPAPKETKTVFGITFEQGRNDVLLDGGMLENVVTENKTLPDDARRDLLVALITLKYTQSNSVAYALDGQAIGVGAGQQSRIHCTRLAGEKADKWLLRQSEQVLSLPFLEELARPDRDNAVDVYLSPDSDDVLAEGKWQRYFSRRPEPFDRVQQRAYLAGCGGVSLASDAFFPFSDNVERAYRSGVRYIVQPGGSKRDEEVIRACNECGITMVCNGVRLFHH